MVMRLLRFTPRGGIAGGLRSGGIRAKYRRGFWSCIVRQGIVFTVYVLMGESE